VGVGCIQGASVEGWPAARQRRREEDPGSWGLHLLLLGGGKVAGSCLDACWHSQCCSSRRMPLRESPGVSAKMAGLMAREACGPRVSFLWRAPSLLQALWTTNSGPFSRTRTSLHQTSGQITTGFCLIFPLPGWQPCRALCRRQPSMPLQSSAMEVSGVHSLMALFTTPTRACPGVGPSLGPPAPLEEDNRSRRWTS
jgi:hypothetical protein